MWQGRVLHIHTAFAGGAPMQSHTRIKAVAGRGLDGDRYATGRGKYSDIPDIREITLIEVETLEALARDHATDLAPAEHRRNITVRDVPLNHLVGRTFWVGDVQLRGGRLNTPCRYLDLLLGRAVCDLLTHRSGLNCEIISNGTIGVDDVVRL